MDIASILAVLSIVVAITAVAYSFWAGREVQKQNQNVKDIDDLKFKYEALQRSAQAEAYIIDTIAGALHCLDNRQTALFYLSKLGDDTGCFGDEEAKQLGELQKRLTELGLFSEDKIRRISVQRALAHVDGDFRSLNLMNKIEKGELGTRDPEIVEQIGLLKRRLEEKPRMNEVWPGRPGGGEF